MLNFTDLFLNSTVRVGRREFVLGAISLTALRAGVDFWQTHGLNNWIALILVLAIGYSAICVLSLRLHDRGRSGWWSWLILLAFHFAWPATRGDFQPTVIIGLIALAAAAVDLVVLPGQKGLNRHGPCPSARGA